MIDRDLIRRRHARFIRSVVLAMDDYDTRVELEQALEIAAENDWSDMVEVIRCLLDGRDHRPDLQKLDAHDRVIADAVLAALADPSTLPPVDE